jgi:hypothetical protein
MLTRIQPSAYLLYAVLLIAGCSKEEKETPEKADKLPPVAIAGDDESFYLSDRSWVELDASKSYDVGGGVSLRYRWKQLSGTPVIGLSEFTPLQTLRLLEEGIYAFELAVYDPSVNVGMDTVTYTVLLGSSCNPDMVKRTASYTLSTIIANGVPIDASFSDNEKFVALAGGREFRDFDWGNGDVYSAKAFLFDRAGRTASSFTLSQARARIGIAITSEKVFFAGGRDLTGTISVIDVYDINTKTLSKLSLSSPRSDVSCAVAGNKVFFAGGYNGAGDAVDNMEVLDLATNTLTSIKMPFARAAMSVFTQGNKIYFAGGDEYPGVSSNMVNVIDIVTEQWSSFQLSAPRTGLSIHSLGNTIAFAGGSNIATFNYGADNISKLDLYDPASGTATSQCLISLSTNHDSFYGGNMSSAVINGQDLYHLGNRVITKYEPGANKWSLTPLPYNTLDVDDRFLGLLAEGNRLFALMVNLEEENYSSGALMLFEIGF